MKRNFLILVLLAGAFSGVIGAYISHPKITDVSSTALGKTPATTTEFTGEVKPESQPQHNEVLSQLEELSPAEIAVWYGTDLLPITIGTTSLAASVADTPAERQQGLSGTPSLPSTMAKLFVFEKSSTWGFWMKDMNYPIDIIWLNEEKRVVHIVSNALPSSYPNQFMPPESALYVIETKPGFVSEQGITLGTTVTFDL